MEEALKQYTAFMVGNLGFFKCDHMPFGLCNALATFQWLMQKCLSKLNLIYCLIYLDDIIVFSWMAEEHLHQLHVVSDQFREYNLKLKPSKYLFKEEINYLAHWVSKEGVQPSNLNLKAIAVLSQKQADGWYHPVTYGSRALTAHEKNYHTTKLEFLALKWVVTEHFKEYLPYQSLLVKTDNNPLTYIMTTPDLNATGHRWVGALARFNFQLEYQKRRDNTMADVLSQITTCLDPDMVRSVLDGITNVTRWNNKGQNVMTPQ